MVSFQCEVRFIPVRFLFHSCPIPVQAVLFLFLPSIPNLALWACSCPPLPPSPNAWRYHALKSQGTSHHTPHTIHPTLTSLPRHQRHSPTLSMAATFVATIKQHYHYHYPALPCQPVQDVPFCVPLIPWPTCLSLIIPSPFLLLKYQTHAPVFGLSGYNTLSRLIQNYYT